MTDQNTICSVTKGDAMAGQPTALGPGPRSRVRRRPQRARYDRDALHAILDEGLVAHLAFRTGSQPWVVPTVYARVDDRLYLHGSPAARWLRGRRPRPVCLAVTLVDGLVIARSAFHHSLNYRSAVVFGGARPVTDAGEKALALEAILEHAVPGRSREARPPDERELRSTAVAVLPIEEASAKVRTGDPVDDEADLSLPVWAGVLPLAWGVGVPVPAADLHGDLPAPPSVTGYVRPTSKAPGASSSPPEGEPGLAEDPCASASSATPTTTSGTWGGSSSS
ncbi:MAG: pyridoxamine 5'-phosphate oxidase family protein [Myxococcota bacterium]|nr:pyridoxamine 5'-phosphate oxidase family protein [Myxococcota bacterium]